jgi:hypothetical protein
MFASCLTFRSSGCNRPQSPAVCSIPDVAGDLGPKDFTGDLGYLIDLRNLDRADLSRADSDVFKRVNLEVVESGRGVSNSSAGLKALVPPFIIELIEALRDRGGWTSTGAHTTLPGWSGICGQDVAEGIDVSKISVPLSSSYSGNMSCFVSVLDIRD